MWTTRVGSGRHKGRTRVSFYLDNDLVDKIDKIAKEYERHRSQQIRLWVKDCLEYVICEGGDF